MSKTIINIKSLTINLPAGSTGVGVPTGLIAAILARASGPQQEATADSSVGTAGTPEAAPVRATETANPTSAAPTANDVLAFLNSDPRYTQRSVTSVFDAFPTAGVNFLEGLLAELVNTGKVKTLRRRSDSATLYQALVHAAPVPVSGTPELSVENIRSFIGSDPRYTMRSAESVAKHFGVSVDDAGAKLEEMADDGDLSTKIRRSDDVALYQLA